MSVEGRIVYFDKPGKKNTDEVLTIVKRRAEETGIKTIVIPSVSGYTASRALEIIPHMNIVVVTAHTGYGTADLQPFPEDLRNELIGKGFKVLTAPHVFGGIFYAMKDMYHTATLGVEMANTIRILGQGMKVVCEAAMAACDAGLVQPGVEVFSVGGTDKGIDTAVTLNPVHVKDIFSLRVKEILCKPRMGGMYALT